MAEHRILTTDDEIEEAVRQANLLPEEPEAVSVQYRAEPGLDMFIVTFSDGSRLLIPREDLKGLEHATCDQISQVEIIGDGLHWEALDLDYYIPALRRGRAD
jgi:hypothetical protein